MTVPERTPAPEDGAAERLRAIEERVERLTSERAIGGWPAEKWETDREWLLSHIASLTADLAASRAEVATERRLNEQHQAALDKAEHERNEARRMIAVMEADHQAASDHYGKLLGKFSKVCDERDEARAEVERLRAKALELSDAWHAPGGIVGGYVSTELESRVIELEAMALRAALARGE